MLFQDWTAIDSELRNVRIVGVQKSNDQGSPNGIGLVFPFEIRNVCPSLVVTCQLHIKLGRVALLDWIWKPMGRH